MSDAAADLRAWLLEPDTAALEPPALLDGLVARLDAAGLALQRVSIWIPTKHPELWGNQLTWDRAAGARVLRRSHEVSTTIDYVGTPAEALHQNDSATLRCRLDREPDRSRFAMLAAMAEGGATDYFLASLDPGEARAAWVSYATTAAGGFDDRQLALLAGLTPLLALHVRLAAVGLATRSLLEVYLGGNASRRVLAGEFRRGTGSELDAALWFCDMRGFTALSDRLSARAVVGLLDQYFEHLATPIEEHGGEILKFIGDAILAVFPIGEAGVAVACRGALAAAEGALARIQTWSAGAPERVAVGIALHLGRVMYGNVGGRTRLDFTVIGASVNEVCRVESMCKTLGQPLLLTAAFAGALGDPDIESLGHHSLRGVAQPQELFTRRRPG
jgi:adenylate cyclase